MKSIWIFIGGRKFVVFLIATILLPLHCISDSTWLVIALVWIGIEGVNDIIKTIKGGIR